MTPRYKYQTLLDFAMDCPTFLEWMLVRYPLLHETFLRLDPTQPARPENLQLYWYFPDDPYNPVTLIRDYYTYPGLNNERVVEMPLDLLEPFYLEWLDQEGVLGHAAHLLNQDLGLVQRLAQAAVETRCTLPAQGTPAQRESVQQHQEAWQRYQSNPKRNYADCPLGVGYTLDPARGPEEAYAGVIHLSPNRDLYRGVLKVQVRSGRKQELYSSNLVLLVHTLEGKPPQHFSESEEALRTQQGQQEYEQRFYAALTPEQRKMLSL